MRKKNEKVNLIESLQKQDDEEKLFFKRVTEGLFDYYCIVIKEEKQKLKRYI